MSLTKQILFIALGVGLILLVPLAAKLFNDDMGWTLFDFVTAGALLFGTGLAFVLVARKANTFAYRAAVGVALATALFLLWVNLAVGIIGSEDEPVNALYLLVLGILVVGALVAQLRPAGMAWAAFAAALAQMLVTGIALVTVDGVSVFHAIALNGMFVVLWVGAGLLFRQAAAERLKASA